MALNELLLALKHELVLSFLLFFLLVWKIRSNEATFAPLIPWVHLILGIAVLAWFCPPGNHDLFGGMFHSDPLTHLQKTILCGGFLLISGVSWHWLKDHKHLPEFYMLLVSALLGMCFMVSSSNLLMFYLGLELSTIPLAAAANFDLEQRRSSEAAMKLILNSAFSSALLLLGISFLYGSTGTLQFDAMGEKLTETPMNIFAFVLVLAGFGFKISAVPFHFWTADVYEGAPVPVTTFLSVISKAAVTFIFMGVLYRVFRHMEYSWSVSIALLSFASIAVGNLFALRQQNMKRFLAFSAIAQVGYILLALVGYPAQAQPSVTFFLMVYLLSNIAAFGVVGIVSAQHGTEHRNDFKGFYQNNKFLTWVLAIALFSLAGVPPTAGFFGKYFLLLSAGGKGNYVLLIIAALNLVISFYYYLSVIKNMFMDPNDKPLPKTSAGLYPGIALGVCLAGILFLGLYGPAYEYLVMLAKPF